MEERNYLAESGISQDSYCEEDFWAKCRRFAGRMGRPLLLKALCLYYVLQAPGTPLHVKAGIMAALAYLVSPFDAVLDLVPVLGFADDAAVIAGAVLLVAPYITPEIEARAEEKLSEFGL